MIPQFYFWGRLLFKRAVFELEVDFVRNLLYYTIYLQNYK